MADSEEVEKVLQSLESETGNVASADGDPDKDKVEELLRQLEQEKEAGNESEVLEHTNDKVKSPTRVLKKPNGVKVGDKPAAPKKSPTREEIPKPWKKKGAVRKKPTEDEDFFVVAAKEPPPYQETSQNDLPTTASPASPTTENRDAVPFAAQAPPRSPPIRANPPPSLPESHEIPNGVSGHSTPPPSSPTPSHAASPTPYSSSPIPSATSSIPPPVSPTPQSPPPQVASPTPQPTSHAPQASPSIPHSPKLQATPSIPNSPNPKTVSPPPQSTPPQTTSPPPTVTLTTSTPPPSQRTPHELTIKKEPQTSSTKQKSAEEMLIDDSVKSDERLFSKQDFENLRNQILFQMNEETAILAQEFQELKAKYDEEIRGKAKLKSVLAEYEKTIAKLIDEAGMSVHHDKLAERVAELENETKRKTDEYDALASAHSELKSRYEETKTDNEKLKSNEQVQKEVISKLQNELHGSETRFNVLKNHAETKLDSASEQLVKMRDERAKEIAMMQTRMQKAEARTATVEKEKQELLVICDDLMHQLEQKNG
eukprot:Phypoly_transcript_05848.p1 GENE.Phypoly_transcript_05848~~Phypoly_transcript_05848.p1  ORF type:complete len:541 (+),score=152.90 Phypoly_transcript_05848:153-1775(+)